MNLRKTPASSMQKTYDECYLICSTAVYFEGQNNEAEALRSWRNALDQIYYHNAYKIPSSYVARTETERALQDSLRTMELQCKERVDLLEALKKSREDASDEGKGAKTADGGANNKSRESLQASLKPFAKPEEKKTWLGNDTVPQTSYEDLPVPLPPALPTRPARPSRPSYISRQGSDNDTSRTKSMPSSSSAALGSPSLAPPDLDHPRPSRTPSPEKKGGMLRTLRTSNPKDRSGSGRMPASLRNRAQPAAAKAATQVWGSGQLRPSNGSVEPANGNGAPANTTWDPLTRSLVADRRMSDQSRIRTASPAPSARDVEIERPTASHLSKPPDYPVYNSAGRDPSSRSNENLESERMAPPPVPPHRQAHPAFAPTPSVALTEASPSSSQTPESPGGESKRLPMPPTLSQLGQAPPISYMKEYPNHPPAKPRKPPEIAIKQANNMAAGSATPTSVDSTTRQTRLSGGSGNSRTIQSNISPMIPRKAIGTNRAAGVVSAMAERQRLDAETRTGNKPIGGKSTISALPVGSDKSTKLRPKAPLDELDLISSSPEGDLGLAATEGLESAEDKAWDNKVKNLLKNLPKGVDESAAKQILNEIVIQGDEVHWADVAGLDIAKSALKETVVYPFLRPDLFMGLREPARGMLLFGPPGTGKTMLARAVATESKSIFFAISASSLTSKYLGDSEKLVRALFVIARALAPSIIFVDEIDSLLGSRGGSSEHEATRRIKTEFLIQWSDLQKAAAGRVDEKSKDTGDPTRVLVLAATNLPWAIDEAARRRFVRRQYIPLPEDWVRQEQLRNLLAAQTHSMGDTELAELVRLTEGFSGSDITALAKDAAMGPLRSLGEKLLHMSPEDIRPIGMQDFRASLNNIRPSVSKQGLKEFEDWAREFGERGG